MNRRIAVAQGIHRSRGETCCHLSRRIVRWISDTGEGKHIRPVDGASVGLLHSPRSTIVVSVFRRSCSTPDSPSLLYVTKPEAGQQNQRLRDQYSVSGRRIATVFANSLEIAQALSEDKISKSGKRLGKTKCLSEILLLERNHEARTHSTIENRPVSTSKAQLLRVS